jgi:hypothetical protein
MVTTVPLLWAVAHETDVRFVDQNGRLQRVCLMLVEQVVFCEPVERAVDDRDQLIARMRVPIRPIAEQASDVSVVWSHDRARTVAPVRSHGEAQDNPTTVEGTVRTRPHARFARVYPHNTIQTGTFCSFTTSSWWV